MSHSLVTGEDGMGSLRDAICSPGSGSPGFDLTVVGPTDAQRIDPGRVDALVVMGAEEAAYDDSVPWLPAELDLVRRAVDLGVPTLGVCFGGQLLARALGAEVRRSPSPEIGWRTIDTADPLLVAAGPWLEFHYDRFSLPPGAVELATTAQACQAFASGPHLGLQFHPEITPALWDLWADGWEAAGDDARLARHGVDLDAIRRQLVADHAAVAARARGLWTTFLRLSSNPHSSNPPSSSPPSSSPVRLPSAQG